ncbi:MAG: hypothetical protein QOG57_7123 [Pseudonocardiales bacterium]|nr:hypothetical protein [Pseudonocardiales bacterium]
MRGPLSTEFARGGCRPLYRVNPLVRIYIGATDAIQEQADAEMTGMEREHGRYVPAAFTWTGRPASWLAIPQMRAPAPRADYLLACASRPRPRTSN